MGKFRTGYDGERLRVMSSPVGVSRTRQDAKAECDINNIMKKFEKTGQLAHVTRYRGEYGDVSHGLDYQDSLEAVKSAHEMFASLPSKVRKHFENDPAKFLEGMTNDVDGSLRRELGLLPGDHPLGTKPEPAPAPAPDAAPPAGK